jgi:transcriptional regulator with XRE-family HTH domain
MTSEVTMARGAGNGSAPEYGDMGDRLREARRAHGLSLRGLAERLGVSPSLISQVETGRARPSVSTLYAIASELGISLDELLFIDARPSRAGLGPSADAGEDLAALLPREPVQRADSRKKIRLASGVEWERLTTASIPNVDFLHVTYEVGGASSPADEFQRHGGQEWGYVLTGTLGVTIGFDDYILTPGDAIAFDSTTPHRLYNAGNEPVHGVWFVLGRRPADVASAPAAAGAARRR